MRAQFRRVAAEMAEAGRQLAVVGSDSTQVILTRLQGLHAELTNLIANGGDGALTEVMTTFQQNLPDFHWIMHHPTEIGFQTWTSLQGHAAAAMNGLQGVVNFLFDEAEEEFDPNMYVVLESFVVPLGNVLRAAHETLPESEIMLTQWSIGSARLLI